MSNSYYTYIIGNDRGTLYTGVTNDLFRRVWEHKEKVNRGFTQKYAIGRLLLFEEYDDVSHAIMREKEIKGWVRRKKLALIRVGNPRFEDLAAGWY